VRRGCNRATPQFRVGNLHASTRCRLHVHRDVLRGIGICADDSAVAESGLERPAARADDASAAAERGGFSTH
jgi:hypothetical protein